MKYRQTSRGYDILDHTCPDEYDPVVAIRIYQARQTMKQRLEDVERTISYWVRRSRFFKGQKKKLGHLRPNDPRVIKVTQELQEAEQKVAQYLAQKQELLNEQEDTSCTTTANADQAVEASV